MLTVNTHHVDEWVESKYNNQMANVLMYADRQISDFVDWCSRQEWYDDNTIIIMGDHPRMDQSLVGSVDDYDRTVYNCFINSVYNKKHCKEYNREFTIIDMYPTILDAMGYRIHENRMSLGW